MKVSDGLGWHGLDEWMCHQINGRLDVRRTAVLHQGWAKGELYYFPDSVTINTV